MRCAGSNENLAELPSAYLKWRASALGRRTDALERDLILDLMGNVAGLNVLDVGCGDGEFAIELWRRGATVYGIDTSPEMVATAKKSAKEHNADLTIKMAAARSLPFPADNFDAVVAVTVLCFIDDPAPVFREMARVLKPGGVVVAGELGKWSSWAAGRRIRSWFGSRRWGRARFWTARELRTMAGDAGLVVKAVRGAIYYPRCELAARLFAPADRRFSRLTTVGAAFVAVSATKPPAQPNAYWRS